MSEFQPLDYLTLPLRGVGLIEASAGTGKTYTLTALYVRLVLGHGTTANFRQDNRPLTPADILVLTFTRAATQELRQRIRAQLAEAAETFRRADAANDEAGTPALQTVIDDTRDSFLHDLLADVASHGDLAVCAKRCADAARNMDLAAIHTLHGFCQRSLKRFAFAAGMAFEQELQTDTAGLQDEVRNDYWRRFMQPLSDAACKALVDNGIDSPARLSAAIRKQGIETGESQTFPSAIVDMEPQMRLLYELRDKAQRALIEQKRQLDDWLAFELEQGHLNARTHSSNKVRHALTAFLDNGKRQPGLESFTPDGLKWKKGMVQEIPVALTCMQVLAEFIEQDDAAAEFPLEQLLQHAADWMDAEQDKRLSARTQITFDTMVTRLATALQAESRETGQPLADQLFQHYPCTLIDEFQDTDQQQYDIFRHVYAGRQADSLAWFMIGDPKQAIYSFRGADIAVYEQASQNTENRYTLTTNYRSATGMVAATNHLFVTSPLEQQTDAGVFGTDSIRYREIAGHGRDDQLVIDGAQAVPLTLCYPDTGDDKPYAKGRAEELLAGQFAARIAGLLARDDDKQVVISKSDGRSAPLEPRQIACLVRKGDQARKLKQALKTVGVDAVFLSEKSSVYDSETALDVFRILSAIAHPHDGRLVRQALACELLAFEPAALVDELGGEERWQQHMRTFRRLRDVWQHAGVLPMLHRLVHELALPERQRDERILTDLFHLAELLQQASVSLDGMDALVHYLEMAIASHEQGSEDNNELLLRLENERDRVIIMTLHGAKGLEFPLVMLPFACLAGGKDWQDSAAEEMRLLYVGITRAAHACWLGLLQCKHGNGKAHQLETAPLGRLLFGDQHQEAEAMMQRLDDLCVTSAGSIRLDRLLHNEDAAQSPNTVLPPLAEPMAEQPRRPADWVVTSYSRLASSASRGAFTAASERILAGDNAALDVAVASLPAGAHTFPRGPEAGNLLHWLLEQACTHGFAECGDDAVKKLVERACQTEAWQPYQQQLEDWLTQILSAALPIEGQALSLRDIGAGLAENEFWLSLQDAHLDLLETYTRQLLPGERSPFPAQHINGMLKGFIDLMFCVNGRYFVLDYKSNHLGDGDDAYTLDAMQRAMLDHRYELQGLIYQLALHRLLRERIPNYDPARHLGGSLFFFLRGIGNDSRGIVHLPADVELLDGVDRLFEGDAA